MADTTMEAHDEAASQVWQTFQALSPLLDHTLRLSQNAPPKRQRKEGLTNRERGHDLDAPEKLQLTQAIMLLTKLTLRMDKELQALKKEDTFLFFFASKGKESSLHNLVQETDQWVQKHQEAQQQSPPGRVMPLRQHLMQYLFNQLLTRIEQLGNAKEGSDIRKAAQSTLVLLPDGTCPYVQWDHQKKSLVVSQRKPLTLKHLHQLCTDLLEALANVNLVTKFHALQTGAQKEVSTWKLQVSLRLDEPWQMLNELCSSAIWMLLGTSLRAHSLTQSPLAQQLQKTVLPSKGAPKGKGKGKNKMHQPTKQEEP